MNKQFIKKINFPREKYMKKAKFSVTNICQNVWSNLIQFSPKLIFINLKMIELIIYYKLFIEMNFKYRKETNNNHLRAEPISAP
jgi:hypothetical protein